MSIPPASLSHSLLASFVEKTDTLNRTGYTIGEEIVVYKCCQWTGTQNKPNVHGKQSSLLRTVAVSATLCGSVFALAETAASLGKCFPGKQKKLRPNKKQLRRLCGATVLCHITWSNSFHCFAMSQQITRRFLHGNAF